MQLQSTSSFANNMTNSIQQAELRIFRKKLELMDLVCCTFYNNDHRCVFSYIIAMTLQQKSIKSQDLSIFTNYLSIIVDLKEGYFIIEYDQLEKRQGKEGKKDKKVAYIKLNAQGFFKIIRKLMIDLQSRLDKFYKTYEFDSARTKDNSDMIEENMFVRKTNKRCKKCHAIQNKQLTKFGFDDCRQQITYTENDQIRRGPCGSQQFEDIVPSQQQRLRILKLRKIIETVYNKLHELETLQFSFDNRIEEIKQIEKQQKVREIDRFMKPIDAMLKQKNEQISIEVNFASIKQAQTHHAPKLRFQKIQLMRSMTDNERRKRAKPIQKVRESNALRLQRVQSMRRII